MHSIPTKSVICHFVDYPIVDKVPMDMIVNCIKDYFPNVGSHLNLLGALDGGPRCRMSI